MFEWSLAAHWDGLTTFEFLDLNVDQQVHIIAAYRIQNYFQAVQAKERLDEVDAQSRKQK